MDMEQDQAAAGEAPPAMGDCANNNPLSLVGASAVDPLSGDNVVAGGGTAGSITVSLHPLVIMNISKHWTRTRAQNDGKPQQVLGAIIGQHKGRHLEIMNSFELVFTVIDGLIVIDRDYYRTKEEQFKQVFSEMDFIGWYTTGDVPNSADIHVHKQICEIYESAVLLKLNPLARNVDELPVSIFESIIDILNGETAMMFVQLPYVLATEEAERIGVDHVARIMSSSDVQPSSSLAPVQSSPAPVQLANECSLVADHLAAQHSAIKMLHSRVRLILDYVKAVEKGEAPMCPDALRLAKSLSHRLPVIQPERFKTDFYEKCSDVSLITYLGMITKGCEEAHQFVIRFSNSFHTCTCPGSCPTPKTIRIFVVTACQTNLLIYINEDETVDVLRSLIEEKKECPVDFDVASACQLLASGRRLSQYKIVDGMTLHIRLALCGGRQELPKLLKRTIYVTNFDYNITYEDLYELFKDPFTINRLVVPRTTSVSGQSEPRCAYIEFYATKEAEDALEWNEVVYFGERPLTIKAIVEKSHNGPSSRENVDREYLTELFKQAQYVRPPTCCESLSFSLSSINFGFSRKHQVSPSDGPAAKIVKNDPVQSSQQSQVQPSRKNPVPAKPNLAVPSKPYDGSMLNASRGFSNIGSPSFPVPPNYNKNSQQSRLQVPTEEVPVGCGLFGPKVTIQKPTTSGRKF